MNRIAIASLGLADTITLPVAAKPALASSFISTVLSVNGEQTVATAVNSAGQVTGSYGGNSKSQAFVWQNGTFRTVPLPKGVTSIDSGPINDSGAAAGVATLPLKKGYQDGIYSFDTKSGKSKLQTLLPPNQLVSVNGIDNAGEIVGSVLTERFPSPLFYAYTLANGKLIKLLNQTTPSAVNGAGEIVGTYLGGGPVELGAFTDIGGTLSTINVSGSTAVYPGFVSRTGVVAGYYNSGKA